MKRGSRFIEDDIHTVKSMKSTYEKFNKAEKDFKHINKHMRDTYFDGRPLDEGLSRSMSALSGLGMAVVTGGLNASSSELQYNTALKEKNKKK